MNIEQMIREASPGNAGNLNANEFRRFAALVAEECAKVCDLEAERHADWSAEFPTNVARACAKNIRDAFRQ